MTLTLRRKMPAGMARRDVVEWRPPGFAGGRTDTWPRQRYAKTGNTTKVELMGYLAGFNLGMALRVLDDSKTTVWSDGKTAYIACSSTGVKPSLAWVIVRVAVMHVRITRDIWGGDAAASVFDELVEHAGKLEAAVDGRTGYRMM